MSERSSGDPVRRSYWVLKGATREFYVCTTAGPRDYRTALCVFDSKAGAKEYRRSLGGAQAFVDTMQSYGMQVPDWMRREPQLPEMHEATVPELRRVTEGIGVEHVTINPPPVEPYSGPQRSGTLPLLPVKELRGPSLHTNLITTAVQIETGEMN